MPRAEVDIDVDLVRGLLGSQRPDLASAEIVPLPHGWDNAGFRVGPDLVARLPRREVAVPLLEKEARWLPELAPLLPLPVPRPVFVGMPGLGYPWPWMLTELVPGQPVGSDRLTRPLVFAARLSEFLIALHRPAPPTAPVNPYRGVSLGRRDEMFRGRLRDVADLVDTAAAESTWRKALAAPAHPGPASWVHGDLHPHNLMTADGELTGVIDFGDLTAGDPATDLAVSWMLFDGPGRAALRDACPGDNHLWLRARGWAVSLGVAMLANSGDNPSMAEVGRRTLEALAGED